MFELGDLVKFREKGVVKRNREHPDKVIAIIIAIERDVYWSYAGDCDDAVRVLWMPLGEEEGMPEFLLEKVEDNT